MNRIDTMPSRGVENALDIEITFAGDGDGPRRWAASSRFTNVKRGAVGIGINGDRALISISRSVRMTRSVTSPRIGNQNLYGTLVSRL